MLPSRRIGFYWGEEKLTVIEFDKNAPLQVVSLPLAAKTSTTPSPFSSGLAEEIQITALLKKILQDNQIRGSGFFVSLPMKEIILRSFIVPFVKKENLSSAIKFEAKKYIPFDIQDLSYVFYTIPFSEGQNKRLQVIFFAARKEVLERYERMLGQVSFCEPYIVSLSKVLLFRKEIKPTEHIAFLILDKNLGRICFIDKGIPQFIREFPIGSMANETDESQEAFNLKIVTEVLNSFDFYSRQFSGERIEQVLVSSEFIQKNLLDALQSELKLKIVKFSPVIVTAHGQSSEMDAIYALGACVTPPLEPLYSFNFLGEVVKDKNEQQIVTLLKPFKETLLTLAMCLLFLFGVNALFQMQLKLAQTRLDQFKTQEGEFANLNHDDIQAVAQQNIDKLAQYKKIRTKSDLTDVFLLLASHLPKGTLLNSLVISGDVGDATDPHVTIDMKGDILNDDPTQQITVVNQVFSDLKNDKKLAQFVGSVNLVTFNSETYKDRQVTAFSIHCS